MLYAVADVATGEVLRVVRCQEEQAAAQALAGEELLAVDAGDVSPLTHYSAAGVLTAYGEAVAALKAVRPEWASSGWDNTTMTWIDPRTLADLKAAKMAALKAARDAEQFGGFVWDGSTFDSDERSQTLLLGMFTTAALGALPDTPFRLADNSWRVLTASDMVQVWSALQGLIGGAFGRFSVVEAAVMAAQDAPTVEAITWR